MATITIVILKRTAVGATWSVVMKRSQNPPSTCPYQGYNANPAASMDNGQWTHTSGGMRCSVARWQQTHGGLRNRKLRCGVQDCNMLRFQSSSQGEVQIRMKRETGPEDQEKEKGRKGIGALLHVYGYFRGSRLPRAHHVSLSAQIHQITSTRWVSSFRFFFFFNLFF